MLGIANTSLAQDAIMGATPELHVDCDSTDPIFFTDNNGGSMLASDPYTDNVVEQIILCPSDPTQGVQVEFIVFDLQTNPNPNNQDYLNIYDGNSDAAFAVGRSTRERATFGTMAPSRHQQTTQRDV